MVILKHRIGESKLSVIWFPGSDGLKIEQKKLRKKKLLS